jgi:hypothetical protein
VSLNYFKPKLCPKSREIASEIYADNLDEDSVDCNVRAYKRLHQLSGRKQEYILELRKLMDKETNDKLAQECSFKPQIM